MSNPPAKPAPPRDGSSKPPVALGIIGCGVIGQIHMQHASRSALMNVAAIADLRESAARDTAQKFGVETVHRNAADLLADPRVEAVVLALPAAGRAGLALDAFACGKHVLLEKPVALNSAEVRRMIAARGNLVAGCCQSRMRQLPSARAAADFVAAGALGDLRVVRCRALSAGGPLSQNPPPAWRLNKSINGGGILVNWGSYDLDYLLGITGWKLKPRLALARTWTVPPVFQTHVATGSDAETLGTALILCEDGAALTFERGEYMPAQTEGAWQIIGSKGSLRLQLTPGQGKKIFFDEAVTGKGVVTRILWEGDETHEMPHAGVIEDFAVAIREGRQPLASLEQALIVQQITDAIYASAESGKAVEI